MRRDCREVIKKMIEKIPSNRVSFIKALKQDHYNAFFQAPEQDIQWTRVRETLFEYIPFPETDWEYEVLSIFTTKTVEELKLIVKEFYN